MPVSEASLELIKAAGGKDVELISLSGVGHSPQFEAQDKFNDEVAELCGDALNVNDLDEDDWANIRSCGN